MRTNSSRCFHAALPLATIHKVIAFHLENQTAKESVTLLPKGDRAVVEIDQLSESCLNPDHPRGRHPAQVFAAAVGLPVDHATGFEPGLAPSG